MTLVLSSCKYQHPWTWTDKTSTMKEMGSTRAFHAISLRGENNSSHNAAGFSSCAAPKAIEQLATLSLLTAVETRCPR